MIISLDNAPDIFEEIQAKYNKYQTNVIILAAADCDSVCTVKILTSLLRTENIGYSVHPVQSYRYIAELNRSKIQPKLANDELHSLILINCGGTVNLTQFLFFDALIAQKQAEFDIRKQEMIEYNEEKRQEHMANRRKHRMEIIRARNAKNGRNNNNQDSAYLDNMEIDDDDDMEDIDIDYDLDENDYEEIDIETEEIKFNMELEEYLSNVDLPESDKFRVYVMDSHRPYHLSNVWDPNEIICLIEPINDINIESYPKPIELINIGMYEMSSDDDDDDGKDSDSDNELKQDSDLEDIDDMNDMDDNNDDLDDGPPRKKRRLSKPTGQTMNNNSNENNGNISNKKSKKMSDREKVSRERAIRKYYKSNYFGLHSSGIVYNMARMSFKDDNEMLWLAILGLTEQFIHEKIKRQEYNMAVIKFRDEVLRHNAPYNPNNGNNNNSNSGNNNNNNNNDNLENINNINNENMGIMDDGASYEYSESSIKDNKIISHRKRGHIQFSTEFRFTLMRFWTLYDSMFYCRYIATKLGVWTDNGKDRLKYFMAKMALPLNESKQPFTNMRREYKIQLPNLFKKHSLEFKLDEDICYGSFTRQHGSHHSISAADMVHALTAVLESDFQVAQYHNNNNNNNNNHDNNNISSTQNNNAGGSNNSNNNIQNGDDLNDGDMNGNNNNNNDNNEMAGGMEGTSGINENGGVGDGKDNGMVNIETEFWQKNFWTCYDSISVTVQHQEILNIAIDIAKERQISIVEMGTKLIEKKCIKSMDIMRYCVIDNKNEFQTAMSLQNLALFLIEAYRERSIIRNNNNNNNNNNNGKTFVLASYIEKNSSYLIIGIPGKKHRGDVQKSPFGIAFRDAATLVGAKTGQDSFEGSVIEVQKDYFKDWLETMHHRLREIIYML